MKGNPRERSLQKAKSSSNELVWKVTIPKDGFYSPWGEPNHFQGCGIIFQIALTLSYCH